MKSVSGELQSAVRIFKNQTHYKLFDYNFRLCTHSSGYWNSYVFLPTVGCSAGDQPGYYQSAGGGTAEVVPHVCRGAGQVPFGQHAGRLLGSCAPQGHPEDIRRQGAWHHRWPEEKPCCFCPHRVKEVGHVVICYLSCVYFHKICRYIYSQGFRFDLVVLIVWQRICKVHTC